MSGRRRKLNPADEAYVTEMVALRRTLSNKALAGRFNVSPTTIYNIAANKRFVKKVQMCARGVA